MRSSVGGYVKSVRVEDVSTSGEGGCRGVGSCSELSVSSLVKKV